MTRRKIIFKMISNIAKSVAVPVTVVAVYALAGVIVAAILRYGFSVHDPFGLVIAGLISPSILLIIGMILDDQYKDAKNEIQEEYEREHREHRELLNTLKRNHYYD